MLVTGEVDASAWAGDDGKARATLELTARDVKFLGKRDDMGSVEDLPEFTEKDEDVPF